jgi:hypothetical protein
VTCDGTRPEALALEIGMSAKVLRGWLRREFPRSPAEHSQPWFLSHDKVTAAQAHFGGARRHIVQRPSRTPAKPGGHRGDQVYVTDLVARLLGDEPMREHRFPWLQGDTGYLLPVDAYFPDHKLVLEYRERQHLAERPDSFGLWDRRMTASGVTRREQRARYDRLRETETPRHDLTLVVINADDLTVDRRGRLLRDEGADLEALQRVLAAAGVELFHSPPED